MRILVLLVAITLVACANPDPVQLSSDTYLIVRDDQDGAYGGLPQLKAEVISDANAFAAARGKVAVPVSTEESNPGSWAHYEYEFRLVDKDSPEAQPVSLEPRADVVVEADVESVSSVPVADETGVYVDIYTELLKLNELREKGILTQAEFDAEKKELLDSN
jgi:hypothetical protein